jgi:AcrR family transcriptional regulator
MARPRLISNEQILAMMKASVLERGPHVSLEVVAERLGVTTPALLKRFGTRQELMVHALRPPEHPAWLALVERGPDGRPFAVQLEEVLKAIIEFFAEAMPCMVALRESGIPNHVLYAEHRVPPPIQGLRLLTTWLQRACDKGLISTDAPETAATAILGSLQARAFMAHLMKKPFTARSQVTYVREVTQLFVRALSLSSSKARPTS